MKTLLKPIAFAALLLAGTSTLVEARSAPEAASTGKGPIAVVNLQGVVGNSNALRAAQSQRAVTYKPQIDAAESRRAAIIAQLQPMAEKFQRDRAAPGANNAALVQEQQTIQQLQDAGTQELQRIMQPVSLSDAYVQEQITDKLGAAMQAAMTANGVSVLLKAEAVQMVTSETYDLTPQVLAQLNTLVPSVQIVPPAGWLPREVRDQQAAQAGQRGTEAGGR
ncbi:MAG: OmpH family outer membrane protein [Pseudomonadota bacterium]|nr:OmpH family outer membrane protein [Pseudomonadota bacterium]